MEIKMCVLFVCVCVCTPKGAKHYILDTFQSK